MAVHTPQPRRRHRSQPRPRTGARHRGRGTRAARWIGLGEKNEADGAAVEAMRKAFDLVAIYGTVVIGEGEMDEAPMLYIGEKVGGGGPPMDIAVDPLEGTTLTAKGGPNAIAIIALAEHGNFLHAPTSTWTRSRSAAACRKASSTSTRPSARTCANWRRPSSARCRDLVACILDRDRHKELIAKVREAGARIMLISDGDVAGVIATAMPESEIDIYLGSGGAPEGVLAAAALRCVGGQMQGRLMFENDEQIERVRDDGHTDPKRKFSWRKWPRAT